MTEERIQELREFVLSPTGGMYMPVTHITPYSIQKFVWKLPTNRLLAFCSKKTRELLWNDFVPLNDDLINKRFRYNIFIRNAAKWLRKEMDIYTPTITFIQDDTLDLDEPTEIEGFESKFRIFFADSSDHDCAYPFGLIEAAI